MKKVFRLFSVMIAVALCLSFAVPAPAFQLLAKASGPTLVSRDGKQYCMENGKKVKKEWKTINGSKYYFGSKGAAKTGVQKVGDFYYYFRENGTLYRPKKASFVTDKTGTYYVAHKGHTLTGWQLIGKDLYNFTSSAGKMRKNCKYHGVTLKADGKAEKNSTAKIKIKALKMLKKVTNENMTKRQKLKAAWGFLTSGKFRYRSKYPDLDQEGWQQELAFNMLKTRSGNCYGFACAFAAFADAIGYDPVLVCGRVHGSRDQAPDGYTRHCWVRIKERYYDPEGQYAGWGRGIYAKTSYTVAHKIQKYVNY